MMVQRMCVLRALVALSIATMMHAAGEVPKSWHSFDKKLAETQRALTTAQANLDLLKRVETSDAHAGSIYGRGSSEPTYRHGFSEPTYNEETKIHGDYAATYELCFSVLFVCGFGGGSALHLLLIKKERTRTGYVMTTLSIFLLLGGIYAFTNLIEFESSHFWGHRHLTIVEAVYFLAQIITTVGYGDILPVTSAGRIVIGGFVVLCILLIAEIIATVTQVVVDRVQGYSQKIAENALHSACFPEAAGEPAARASVFFNAPSVSYMPTITSGCALMFFFCAGALFFHYYPGEEKTWFQAVYMALITLSTVGFGAFTAETPGGQVFGAFWMVFGVAAVATFIGSFAELLLMLKTRESHCAHKVRRHMRVTRGVLRLDTRPMMDRADFLRFAALQLGIASLKQLEDIQSQFDLMDTDGDGSVRSLEIEKMMGRHTDSDAHTFTWGFVDTFDSKLNSPFDQDRSKS